MTFEGWGNNNQSYPNDSDPSEPAQQASLFGSATSTTQRSVFGAFGQNPTFSSSTFGTSNPPSAIFGQRLAATTTNSTTFNTRQPFQSQVQSIPNQTNSAVKPANVFGASIFEPNKQTPSSAIASGQRKSELPSYSASTSLFGVSKLSSRVFMSSATPQALTNTNIKPPVFGTSASSSTFGQSFGKSTASVPGLGQFPSPSSRLTQAGAIGINQPSNSQFVETIGSERAQDVPYRGPPTESVSRANFRSNLKGPVSRDNPSHRKRSFDEDGFSQNQSLQGSQGVDSANEALRKKRALRVARNSQALRAMLTIQKHISPGEKDTSSVGYSRPVARQSVMPTQPLRRTRRVSSSLTEQTGAMQSLAIICHDVPTGANTRGLLESHFSQFGEITRIATNLEKNTATVTFKTHEQAAAAKTNGAYLVESDSPMKIFFVKKVRKSVEKSPAISTKDVPKFTYPGSHKTLVRATKSRQGNRFPVKSQIPKPVFAKSDEEKLEILEKIDTLLRKHVVKQYDIKKARTSKGTCPDMCPEKERYFRQQRKLLATYEMDGSGGINHAKAIKEYSRSSADQEEPLPHELRPASVLQMTMHYLLLEMMPKLGDGQIADWYDFIWNRTRAIRKELTIQQISNTTAVHINEQCARFHIFCAHHLCEEDRMIFDPKINNENLEKTMKTVMDLYSDIYFTEGSSSLSLQDSNVAEMYGYYILLNINKTADVLNELQGLPPEVRFSPDIGFAVGAFMAVHSNNYAKFFKAVRGATFLQGCILHRYFNQVRRKAVSTMTKAYKKSYPAEDFMRILSFNDMEELTLFCQHHGIDINADYMLDLSRSGLNEPESAMVEKRSNQVLGKIQQRSLAEIIAKCEIVQQDHEPYSSFDKHGKYIGEHAALLSAQNRPSQFQAIMNQPSTSTAEAKPVLQVSLPPGVTGVDVKAIAKELFHEVIDEMGTLLVKNVYEDAHCCNIGNKLLDEVICETGQSVADEAICEAVKEKERELARRKAMEEEKRKKESMEKEKRRLRLQKELEERLEKERLQKEKEDMQLEQTAMISAHLRSVVEKDIINEVASETLKEALRQHKIDLLSSEELERVTNEVVSNLLTETCKDVYVNLKKRQCQSIFLEIQTLKLERLFNKWSQKKSDKMKFQNIMRTFPNVPYSRQIGEQIKTLIPNQKPFLLIHKRSSFPLDINSEASLRSPMDVARGRKRCKTYFNQTTPRLSKLYKEALKPLPFCELLKKAIKTAHFDQKGISSCKDILWKIALCIPLCNSDNQKQLSWLCHAFLGDKKFSCLYNSLVEESGRKVSVCCSRISENCTRMSLMGSCSIVLVLLPLTEDQDSQQYWANARARLEKLVSMKPSIPTVPLLIILLDWHIESDVLDDTLGLPLLDFAFSRYSTLSLYTGAECTLKNYEVLTTGVQFLFTQLPVFPDLTTVALREFFESGISTEYVTPLYRHICQRQKANALPLEPAYQVEFYNYVVESLAGGSNSEEFMEISWPPPEFLGLDDNLQLPKENWNSEETLLYNYDNMLRCRITPFPDLSNSVSESEIVNIALSFAASVCPSCPALLSAVKIQVESELQRFSDAIDLAEEESDTGNLAKLFDWHLIIDCVISQHLTNLLYHDKLGNYQVTFPSDVLRSIGKHPGFETLFSQTDFSTLNEMPIASSEKLLTQSQTVEIEDSFDESDYENKKHVADTTWIKEENDVTKTMRDTEKLCQQVKQEQQATADHEKRLQELLLEGEIPLGILDSSSLSSSLLSSNLPLFF